MKQEEDSINKSRKIWTMVKILIVLFIFSSLIALFINNNDETVTGYNTAIIPIKHILSGITMT